MVIGVLERDESWSKGFDFCAVWELRDKVGPGRMQINKVVDLRKLEK